MVLLYEKYGFELEFWLRFRVRVRVCFRVRVRVGVLIQKTGELVCTLQSSALSSASPMLYQ